VVGAVPLLRPRHRAPRSRTVSRAAQPGRQRRHQGALPDVDQARPDGDGVRDHRRHPARGVRRAETQHRPRLHRDGHCKSRLRITELPRRDAPHLLLRVAAQGLHRVTDERLERPELVDPAHDRPRHLPDDLLRAARTGHRARDDAAGLHPHGEGEGPALAHRRRQARAAELADPRRHGRRPGARRSDHGLVHRRDDLRDPGDREVLRDGGDRA
jgi:hypothetical protein